MNKEVILRNDEEVERIKFEDVKTSDIIGFIDGSGNKGFFVYVGDGFQNGLPVVRAIKSALYPGAPNISYGDSLENRFTSVPKSFDNVPIARMRVFDKLQGPDGLYAWLSKEE